MNSKDPRFWPEVINQFKEEMRIRHEQGIVVSGIEVGNLLSKIAAAKRAEWPQTHPENPDQFSSKGPENSNF